MENFKDEESKKKARHGSFGGYLQSVSSVISNTITSTPTSSDGPSATREQQQEPNETLSQPAQTMPNKESSPHDGSAMEVELWV